MLSTTRRLATRSRFISASRTRWNSMQSSPPPPPDFRERVREWTDRTGIAVRQQADDFTNNAKIAFSQLGSQLNRVTGYEEIEALKRKVVEKEAHIDASRQAAREAKTAYNVAVINRSNSQREVNDLLARKSTWTDNDVARFTAQVKEDHLCEQEEIRAKRHVDEMEDAVEKEFSELLRTILGRYHEEQVWSDKIRSASTYGQLVALALNMLVFVMAILVVEPWKRRRLAQTFENKVEKLSAETKALVEENMARITKQLEEIAELAVAAPAPAPVPEPVPIVDSEQPLTTQARVELAVAAGTAAAWTIVATCWWMSGR